VRRALLASVVCLLMAGAATAGVTVTRDKRWPLTPGNRFIPVFISADYEEPLNGCVNMAFERCAIREAIRRWNSVAFGIVELREVAAPPPSGPYIEVRKERFSDFAFFTDYGSTGVGLTSSRDNAILIDVAADTGTIIHEFGHRVGLYHEHQHCRRDEFIDVHLASHPWYYRQFTKQCDSSEVINSADIDFRSIMFYGADAGWSLKEPEGGNRMRSQGIQDVESVGNVKNLSSGDIDALFNLYCDAPGACPVMTPIENQLSKEPVSANHPKVGTP